MIQKIEEADGIIELIYAYEPLSYYFSIKPNEFWEMSFKEICMYCEIQSIRVLEDLKKEIQVQEAVTDKLIGASMVQIHPKVISLKSMFDKLFQKEKIKVQSAEEQAKIMRQIMAREKDNW